MKKLTTMVALLKRVRRKPELTACAMAALLFLAPLPTPAQAQNTYSGATVIHGGSIGLVPGQTVSITVPNSYFAADGSIRFFKESVLRVYDRESHQVTERESGLVYSGESGGLNEASHEYGNIFTLSYGDLPVQGEPRTGRKEVWIEVESISFPATQTRTEDSSAVVLPPTFELIDPDGRTVIFGLLLPAIMKVRSAQPTTSVVNIEGGGSCVQTDEFALICPLAFGMAAGQTVRILIEAADAGTASLNQPSGESGVISGIVSAGAHVKVFNAATGALLWSRELTSLTPGLNTFDINRDELREVGNPGTGRIQLWIEVAIVAREAGQGLPDVNVFAPAFEVFDNESGKTTVLGPMKESMETMKKAWKDASPTVEGVNKPSGQ